jgi:hypothetical protein
VIVQVLASPTKPLNSLGNVFVAESSHLGSLNPTNGTVPLIDVLPDEVEDWCHTVHRAMGESW